MRDGGDFLRRVVIEMDQRLDQIQALSVRIAHPKSPITFSAASSASTHPTIISPSSSFVT